MRHETQIANPFAMLLDPERIAREVECSERLKRLHSRICRPLDKPLIARRGNELDEFDAEIEDSVIEPELDVLESIETMHN
ncbi:hypothetical protein [Roseateles sp.]|jgi:hypothetical protein|uniref:hypothetical protein n=1 Tax=Roseateles sp. TaxID=1971397 RepID=UPI0037CAAD0D